MVQPPIWGNLRSPWEIAYIKSYVETTARSEVRTFDMGPETLPLVEEFGAEIRQRVDDSFETECYLTSLAFLTSVAEFYLLRLFFDPSEAGYRPAVRALLLTKTHHRGADLERLVDVFLGTEFFTRLDRSLQKLVEHIVEEGYDYVGCATHITSYPIALFFLQEAKRLSPQIKTVISGYQATVSADETLAHCPWVDLVVRGESEGGYAAILNSGMPGRAVVDRRGLALDMDHMPTPDYRDLDLSQYKLISIMASRNCPHGKCKFCQEEAFWSRFRFRSADRLVEDMEVQHRRHGIRRFDFVDLDIRDFALELSDLLKDKGHEFSWSGAMRADKNTPSILKRMAAARCKSIFFGFESGSRRLLTKMQKNITPETLEATLRAAADTDVRAKLTCIAGLPTETRREFQSTLDFVERNVDRIRLVLVQCFKVLTQSPIGVALEDPENEHGLKLELLPELERVRPLLYSAHYSGLPSPDTAIQRFIEARRFFRFLGVSERALLLSSNTGHQRHVLGLR